jgi:hypothetical protein
MRKERDILADALERLENAVAVKTALKDVARGIDGRDAHGLLTISRKGKKARYLVDVRRGVTKTTLGGIAMRLKAYSGNPPILLAADYIAPEQAATLHELRIPFIDAHGNAFVETDWLYVRIQGMKTRAAPVEKAAGADLFGWAGVKVTFALLCAETLRTATYRDIADATGVALGTVAGVMQGLKRAGYLRHAPGGAIRLRNARELANRWVTAYAEKLRAKQLIGRYETDERMDVETIRTCNALIGGETAAQHMQRYLKPGIETVYVEGEPKDILLRLRLKKNPKGNVELRRIFWHFEYPEHAQGVTPPLLTYADLLAVADPRTLEAAGKMYHETLDRYLRET